MINPCPWREPMSPNMSITPPPAAFLMRSDTPVPQKKLAIPPTPIPTLFGGEESPDDISADWRALLEKLLSLISLWFSEFLKSLGPPISSRDALWSPAAAFGMLMRGIITRVRNRPPSPILNPMDRNSIYNHYTYGLQSILAYYDTALYGFSERPFSLDNAQ